MDIGQFTLLMVLQGISFIAERLQLFLVPSFFTRFFGPIHQSIHIIIRGGKLEGGVSKFQKNKFYLYDRFAKG